MDEQKKTHTEPVLVQIRRRCALIARTVAAEEEWDAAVDRTFCLSDAALNDLLNEGRRALQVLPQMQEPSRYSNPDDEKDGRVPHYITREEAESAAAIAAGVLSLAASIESLFEPLRVPAKTLHGQTG